MELCLEHAREVHHLSVDRVADRMGLSNKWNLYKWMESGRLPTVLIRPFECACGIAYVTQYLAYSDHKLLVEIPAGRQATPTEVHELQSVMTEATGFLIRHYQGEVTAEQTVAALTAAMSGLAWHRENVGKADQPELGLFEGDQE
jgi:hypothetical protein